MYAIDLLLNMMQIHYKNFEELDDEGLKKEFAIHIHQIIDSLLIRIGRDNIALRERAEDVLGKVSHFPLKNYAE